MWFHSSSFSFFFLQVGKKKKKKKKKKSANITFQIATYEKLVTSLCFFFCNLIFNIFTASNICFEGLKIRGFTLKFAQINIIFKQRNKYVKSMSCSLPHILSNSEGCITFLLFWLITNNDSILVTINKQLKNNECIITFKDISKLHNHNMISETKKN